MFLVAIVCQAIALILINFKSSMMPLQSIVCEGKNLFADYKIPLSLFLFYLTIRIKLKNFLSFCDYSLLF